MTRSLLIFGLALGATVAITQVAFAQECKECVEDVENVLGGDEDCTDASQGHEGRENCAETSGGGCTLSGGSCNGTGESILSVAYLVMDGAYRASARQIESASESNIAPADAYLRTCKGIIVQRSYSAEDVAAIRSHSRIIIL